MTDEPVEVYDSSYVRIYWDGDATFSVFSKVAGYLVPEERFTVYGIDSVDAARSEAWIWAGSE